MSPRKRICILIYGHLATTPRMVKAADALAEEGYAVRVVSTRSTPWADAGDADIMRRRSGAWEWTTVDYRRSSLGTYLRSGVRQKICRGVARALGPSRVSSSIASLARDRVLPELVNKACEVPVDFIYGGGGSLVAAAHAARRMRVPFAIDLEDFHSTDQVSTGDGQFLNELTERTESEFLGDAVFRTGGSAGISAAYTAKYGVAVETVNNTFSICANYSAGQSQKDPLRLYWFSQTIGAGRGLEDVIKAAGETDLEMEFHLQGRNIPAYAKTLFELNTKVAPKLRLVLHEPAMPDEMVSECSRYDVGIAAEETRTVSRDLALTNKALSYVAAGTAVALTDTVGQRVLARDLGTGALFYSPGDIATLADGLRKWSCDRELLARAKHDVQLAARRRWNWDHGGDKSTLLAAIERVFGSDVVEK